MAKIQAIVPTWQHDCGRCVFLGCYGKKDMYVCEGVGGGKDIIVRLGSKGEDYSSMSLELINRLDSRYIGAAMVIAAQLADVMETGDDQNRIG